MELDNCSINLLLILSPNLLLLTWLVRLCRSQRCWQPGSLGVGYVGAIDFWVAVEGVLGKHALAKIAKT